MFYFEVFWDKWIHFQQLTFCSVGFSFSCKEDVEVSQGLVRSILSCDLSSCGRAVVAGVTSEGKDGKKSTAGGLCHRLVVKRQFLILVLVFGEEGMICCGPLVYEST